MLNLTDAEQAVVARGHCEHCGDYVEPAAKKRHRAFCALVVEMVARRDGRGPTGEVIEDGNDRSRRV